MNKQKINLDQFPTGNASNNNINACLILEGGAFRGMYTAGVLDAFMLNDININTAIGVSAGALNATNYLAGNIARTIKINLDYRFDKRYIGFKALQRNKGIIGYDLFFNEEVLNKYPLNLKRLASKEKELLISATNCLDGQSHFFNKDASNIFLAIKASASMPIVSKMVYIDGEPYLDGGCSKKIPIDYALNKNYEKIIIINTREREYRRPKEKVSNLTKVIYHNYPNFVKALDNVNADYNQTVQMLDTLEQQKRIFRIAPSEPITVSRLEKDLDKLTHIYWLGHNDALKALPALKEYLNK